MFLETILLIAIIIVLVVVTQMKSALGEKLDFLYHQIQDLNAKLATKDGQSQSTQEQNLVDADIHVANAPGLPEEKPFKPFVPFDSLVEAKIPEPKLPPITEPISLPATEKTVVKEPEIILEHEFTSELEPIVRIAAEVQPNVLRKYTPAPHKPSFTERNPDLEKFIGENLFNKVGIVILVLGMGFFLKYAIDKDWINEIGRVSIGILCSGGMIALAHRMRKSFATFSSVLVGGGIAILYFTITIGYQQYHLFSQTLAFIITILITAFTVLLSVSYNRKELALFAVLGGFGAPFMVSNGPGNYVVLLTYILTLNVGMLILAYYKKWSIINIVCYILTILLYGSWLLFEVITDAVKHAPYAGALIFATLFYLVFLVMNIINNIKQKTNFNAMEIGILLSNTFLYYGASMFILNHIGGVEYRGLFTVAVGVINLIFAYALYKHQKIDRNLIYLLIGLALTFVTLAAPVQLNGNYITLFWAAESVLLLWLSQKSDITLIRQASIAVLTLMGLSLVLDWQQVYWNTSNSKSTLTPIVNKGFITGFVVLSSLILYYRLLITEIKSILFDEVKTARTIIAILAIGLGYFIICFELNYQASVYFPQTRILALGAVNYLYLIVVAAVIKDQLQNAYKLTVGALIAVSLACYLFVFNFETIVLRNAYFKGSNGSFVNYLFHYLPLILAMLALNYLYKFIKNGRSEQALLTFQWVASFFIIYLTSAELDHLMVTTQYSKTKSIYTILDNTHKTGFAILWGCFGFLYIYIGMKWKSKNIRIISITLLGITLLKLLLFDLRNLSEGGKIAVFISLGILLLIISFMYQRLKKLLLDNDLKSKEATQHDQSEQN